jgi:hypothetical protein
VIPSCKDQPRQLGFDRAAYQERDKFERLIGRLKQYRSIDIRYVKRAANYSAMVTLGMTMLELTQICSPPFGRNSRRFSALFQPVPVSIPDA